MSIFRYKDKIIMGHNSLAEMIDYENKDSQLQSKNVQNAVDELANAVSIIDSQINNNTIYYNEEDNHFYITNGITTKKLGSGEGTATATQVLVGSTFTSEQVEDVTEGTMPNNGSVNITLDSSNVSYPVPLGYHDGEGEVKIVLQEKDVNASLSDQQIMPDNGKVLSKVTVHKVNTTIPNASDIKKGSQIIISSNNNELTKVTGTMNNYENLSLEANSLSFENDNLYFTIKNRGVYNTNSKIYASLSDVKSSINAYSVILSGNTLTLS
mgnify:CR=1 FL=1